MKLWIYFSSFLKLKCPNLLKPLGTIIQQHYWSFYSSEPFTFTHSLWDTLYLTYWEKFAIIENLIFRINFIPWWSLFGLETLCRFFWRLNGRTRLSTHCSLYIEKRKVTQLNYPQAHLYIYRKLLHCLFSFLGNVRKYVHQIHQKILKLSIKMVKSRPFSINLHTTFRFWKLNMYAYLNEIITYIIQIDLLL